MTDHDPTDYAPTREDVLIGRLVDGEATPADWAALDAVGAADPGVWKRLAQAQRAHARLEREVEDRIAVSELIDLPFDPHANGRSIAGRIGRYAGWAAAAVMALALFGVRFGLPQEASETAVAGISLESATSDELRRGYVETGMASGRVLGEMPLRFLDTAPAGVEGDGRHVYFVRSFVERVPAETVIVHQWHQDEAGRPVSVPVNVDLTRAPGAPL